MSSFVNLQESEHDEWIDVTTREDTLKREVEALKRALEEKTFELAETNITVDIFKGHKLLLENERSSLQDELCTTTASLSCAREDLESYVSRETSLRTELENFKASAAEQIRDMSASIDTKSDEVKQANDRIIYLTNTMREIEVTHKKEAAEANRKSQDLSGLVHQLQSKITSMQTAMRDHQIELNDSKQKEKESSCREETLRQQLAREHIAATERNQELQALRVETGAIAIMSESLRADKQSLQCKLTRNQAMLQQTQEDLKETRSREELFKSQISELSLSSNRRIMKLTQSLASSTRDVEESNLLAGALASSVESLKDQMAEVELSLHAECEKTRQMKQELDRLSHELAIQEKLQMATEEHLREDLLAAKEATERRLNELRAILGVRRDYVAPKPIFLGYQPPILSTVMSLI